MHCMCSAITRKIPFYKGNNYYYYINSLIIIPHINQPNKFMSKKIIIYGLKLAPFEVPTLIIWWFSLMPKK